MYKQFFKKKATEKQSVKSGQNIWIIFSSYFYDYLSPFVKKDASTHGLFSYIQQALGNLSVKISSVRNHRDCHQNTYQL